MYTAQGGNNLQHGRASYQHFMAHPMLSPYNTVYLLPFWSDKY